MANVLPKEKQVAVISALAEGSSIRSIERMTGINRNTIMNLGVRVGQGCWALLDAKMRGLTCHLLQFDEIWGFIGKKQKHISYAVFCLKKKTPLPLKQTLRSAPRHRRF